MHICILCYNMLYCCLNVLQYIPVAAGVCRGASERRASARG